MRLLKHLGKRTLTLLACTSTLGVGILVEACSSSSSGGFDSDDAGTDGTVNPSGNDAGADTGPSPGVDAGGGDAGGHCTPISGICDIVLQDCPKSKTGQTQECVWNGSTGTQCVPTQASEQLPTGRACCPSQDSNPCLPGLECVGDPCPDAGPDAAAVMTGRCSPHCCSNDQCGVSDPEGISGSCNVTETSGGKDLYYVCAYQDTCKPLGVQPCKSANSACVVQDKFGTGNCGPVFGTASQEHQACGSVGKECVDGTMCFYRFFPDGGQIFGPDASPADECLYLCHTPNSATPFDGGLLTNAAGHGGCPGTETCKAGLDTSQFPAWLSLCAQ